MCLRCRRPLLRASITIGTAQGPRYYGPKCAEIAGLVAPAKKPAPKTRAARASASPQQMDWLAEVAS